MDFSGNNTYTISMRGMRMGRPTTTARTSIMVSTLWEIPYGRGKRFGSNISKPLDMLIGGWQTNGVWNWATGLPFTPTYRS